MNQDKRPDAAEARELVAAGATLVDVRTQEEWDEGHVKGALLLPHREVAQKAASVLPDKNAQIVLYCRSGNRTELAKRALDQMGYANVRSMTGGFDDLRQTGIETE